MARDCADCADRGEPGGCESCGREREETANEAELAFWDRVRDAQAACKPSPRQDHFRCSLGTSGCRLYHGRVR